ncbi:multiple PDZ domain -like [Brachionus plicatilis]|uniref:Multiple PDZ domain-like n=1 Tax=Brachionus plicatilis TaxID=10195 RepID=A0A3M7S143_BRAPC|nr:multiple PDZ domain -like [Brachionus plicatilis]
MMVLNTEWTQLEIVELLNELPSQNLDDISSSTAGNGGFGFGITGNKSTGVVVKVITQGGSAAKNYPDTNHFVTKFGLLQIHLIKEECGLRNNLIKQNFAKDLKPKQNDLFWQPYLWYHNKLVVRSLNLIFQNLSLNSKPCSIHRKGKNSFYYPS